MSLSQMFLKVIERVEVKVEKFLLENEINSC